MELNLDLDVSAISKYFLQTISDLLYLSVLWVFVLNLLATTFLIGALCFLVRLAGIFVRMIESVHIARRISSVATTFRYMRGYVTSQRRIVIPWKWERKMLDTHSPSELDIYRDGEIHYIPKAVVYQRLEGECVSYTVHVHEEEENAKSPEYNEVRTEMPNKDGKTADSRRGWKDGDEVTARRFLCSVYVFSSSCKTVIPGGSVK
jgi:bifunctional DNA-binding transcriptional regulator/antitoxin component of YhaV-PrlF toxin-antitoxin module